MSSLPFQVGDLIELKSFETGYRGAWFRCKIIKIREKGGVMSYQLEYPDYPDQKKTYIKVYQISPYNSKSKGSKKELMVRPCYPTIYRKSEKLDVNTISEVIVIVDDAWKVGDLVDWFSDGCYWCGTVTEVFGDDKVQVDLLPHPLGEGDTYKALTKDLRPSLDWSPEKGWTVRMPTAGCRCPARIMNPENSGNVVNINAAKDVAVDVGQPSYTSKERREQRNSVGNGVNIEKFASNKNGGTCVSSSHITDSSIENFESTAINSGYHDEYPTKKMKINTGLRLNSMFSNTTESGILDLEELLNRIKWLRSMMKCEIPLSGNKHPSWKFLQHHAPCK
ncbi:unnamed protein product [Trifolium pratense]|uniref:Uncharacterized protein n=2 Tax=Trifolium pratense TaxID=57577 RepID=A0ACB0KEW6_TRIPR|nr:unnamed protein product [Trifolium pratense]